MRGGGGAGGAHNEGGAGGSGMATCFDIACMLLCTRQSAHYRSKTSRMPAASDMGAAICKYRSSALANA